MSKADAEVIKMLLWAIMLALSTNPFTNAIAIVWMGIHGIVAIITALAEENK